MKAKRSNASRKKEKRLIELAKKAWKKTLKEFYYPPLSEPRFVFDYSHKEGFYIDPHHRWRITMNLASSPTFGTDQEYIDYFHAISMHEVSHYQVIPYDGLTNARLLKAAMKHVNQNFAPIVLNVFADLIIDTKLHQRYPELMLWELQNGFNHVFDIQQGNLSEFSKFLFKAYEEMLDVDVVGDRKCNLREYDDLARKVVGIISKDFEDERLWEKKVEKVARLLNTFVNNTFSLIGTGGKVRKDCKKRESPSTPGTFIEVPEDVLEIMDNPLENKNGDKLNEKNEDELKQKAEEFAKDASYSEFGAPAQQAGILIDANPLATWYRGLARNLIEIQIFEEKRGGELPAYTETWRIGEPIEQLDVVQTLLNSPVIIPNITTRKWVFKEGPGHLEETQIPDLLIVLDSSGSMGWNYANKKPSGTYHTALVASFASLQYAANKGAKFSVINFSNLADICQWTHNFDKAEKTLLRYQGGGTHLPTDKIIEQCNKAERKALVFIITDFGIYNWGDSKKAMMELVNQGHKIVGFFIGAAKIPKNRFKKLLEKVTFYPIRKPEDLINLVIKEVKKHYSS